MAKISAENGDALLAWRRTLSPRLRLIIDVFLRRGIAVRRVTPGCTSAAADGATVIDDSAGAGPAAFPAVALGMRDDTAAAVVPTRGRDAPLPIRRSWFDDPSRRTVLVLAPPSAVAAWNAALFPRTAKRKSAS